MADRLKITSAQRYIAADGDQRIRVLNSGPGVVYYGASGVSSTSNDGNVASGSIVTLDQGKWFVSSSVSVLWTTAVNEPVESAVQSIDTLRDTAENFYDRAHLIWDAAEGRVVPGAPVGLFRVDDYDAIGNGVADDFNPFANAWEAALDVKDAGGVGLIALHPLKTYLLGANGAAYGALRLRPHTAGAGYVGIVMNGATIKLSTDCPRLTDFAPYAQDYDTWGRLLLLGGSGGEVGVIDTNNVGGLHHIGFGNKIGGSVAAGTRQNYERIIARNLEIINTPTSGSVASDPDGTDNLKREFFYLPVRQLGDGEAIQNTITDVVLDNIRMEGGNNIGLAGGTGPDASTRNVYTDRFFARKLYFDSGGFDGTGVVASGCLVVGSRGNGGWYYVCDSECRNAGDVGFEFDGCQLGELYNCRSIDARTTNFYHTNFKAPASPSNAVFRVRDCQALRINERNSTGVGSNVPDTGVASNDFEVINFQFHSTCTSPPDPTNTAVSISNKTGRIVLRDVKAVVEGFTYTTPATALTPQSVFIRCEERESAIPVQVSVDNLTLSVDGARDSGAGTLGWIGLYLSPRIGVVNVNRVFFDWRFTGLAGAGGSLIDLGAYSGAAWSGSVPSTIDFTLRDAYLTNYDSDATGMNGLTVRSTATLTLTPSGRVENLNFSKMTVGKEINLDATQAGKLVASRIAWRTSGTGSAKPLPATQTVGASPYVYTNTGMFAQRVVVRGGTVSKVELSTDAGSTWRDTGATAGMFHLQVADQLRTTYTVAPTVDVIPEAAL